MIRTPLSQPARIALGLACVLLLVGVYTYMSQQRSAAAAARDVENLTMPTWSQLGQALVAVCTPHRRTGEVPLWEDTLVTGWRLLVGLFVAVTCSVVVGVAMGCFTPIEAFLFPTLSFLAKIPPTAMLAVFFVLVGTDFNFYLAILVFGTLPTLSQTIHQAARSDVPQELIDKAYTIGAHHSEVIWNVICRQIFPRILEAVRLAVGPAMVLLIAAEFYGTGPGFGFRIRYFWNKTDMTVVYVYLILLGAAGYAIDSALARTRRWLCPWFGP